jgi:hypothetical protein
MWSFEVSFSFQIFSLKNANPSFYKIHMEDDYFPLPSKFEMIWRQNVHIFCTMLKWPLIGMSLVFLNAPTFPWLYNCRIYYYLLMWSYSRMIQISAFVGSYCNHYLHSQLFRDQCLLPIMYLVHVHYFWNEALLIRVCQI